MEELRKWRTWGNERPGKCRTWVLEDPEKWRVQENEESEDIEKRVLCFFFTLFFFLQLFGDSWISMVVAGALTAFSTAPITR
jgi:hypothetical protein